MKTMVRSGPPTMGTTLSTIEKPQKYLSFRLAKEEFAIEVLSVREIMGMQEVTSVPQTPSYVKGVINLRGKVIPVIDLRLKFGLPAIEYSQRTCIIVVQIEGQGGKMLMGVIVDGVSEVLSLHAADIEDAPDFGNGTSAPYILGMAKIKNKVKILLDINMVLTALEVQKLETVLS
jgi:purine-binding chemotaxis protein CheW